MVCRVTSLHTSVGQAGLYASPVAPGNTLYQSSGKGHRNTAKTKLLVKNVRLKFIKEQVKELNLFRARFQSVKHLRTAALR